MKIWDSVYTYTNLETSKSMHVLCGSAHFWIQFPHPLKIVFIFLFNKWPKGKKPQEKLQFKIKIPSSFYRYRYNIIAGGKFFWSVVSSFFPRNHLENTF